MRIVYYGGRQSGAISLLTLLALQHKVICVIPVDEPVELIAKSFGLNIKNPDNVNENKFVDYLEKLNPELFVCCHGRQIIKSKILELKNCKAINLHPCLYKYKGAEPIRRLLVDKEKKASVAAHWMTEKVDDGEVIVENFQNIESDTVVGVYNELYPLYAKTLIDALKVIEKYK